MIRDRIFASRGILRLLASVQAAQPLPWRRQAFASQREHAPVLPQPAAAGRLHRIDHTSERLH
jgi:hypothetical protein